MYYTGYKDSVLEMYNVLPLNIICICKVIEMMQTSVKLSAERQMQGSAKLSLKRMSC